MCIRDSSYSLSIEEKFWDGWNRSPVEGADGQTRSKRASIVDRHVAYAGYQLVLTVTHKEGNSAEVNSSLQQKKYYKTKKF